MDRRSYYNLLIEYNSTAARAAIPEVFPYLDVIYNHKKYPGKRAMSEMCAVIGLLTGFVGERSITNEVADFFEFCFGF